MYYIGIDLGGTNIAAAVVDRQYNILGRGKIKTNSPRPAAEILQDMAETARMAVQDAGVSLEDIASVGVGSPGTINPDTGYIEYANNLAFTMVPAREILERELRKEIHLENDANCAALGEAVAGCGEGVKNFVAVTLGTGVGSGIIIDGKIVNGVNYAGGECGHMVIQMEGELCTCGRHGCWEAYASATALIRQTKDAMEAHPDSLMHELVRESGGRVTGRTAFDAKRRGDEAGTRVVDRYIKYISVGLVNLINALQPEILCVGGGICNEGDYLLDPIREFAASHHYSMNSKTQTKILKACLGNDAGLIGAAILGMGQ